MLMNARGSLLFRPNALAGVAAIRIDERLADPRETLALSTLPSEPGPYFSFGCFEFRLDDDPRMDFLACALDHDGAREAVLQCEPEATGSHGDLLRSWANGVGGGADTAGLWFEWDHRPDGSWLPFAFLRAAEHVPPGRWEADRLARWLRWGLPLLAPDSAPVGGIEQVLRLNSLLPHSCKIQHVAALASRGSTAIRLHVGVAAHEVPECLKTLGWSGGEEEVRAALASWTEVLPDPIGMQFEIGGGAVQWVDLEFYLNTTPSLDPSWSSFTRWVEGSAPFRRSKLVPALAWGTPCAGDDPQTILLRRTSFKARFRADGSVAVKAYLGFSPRRIG